MKRVAWILAASLALGPLGCPLGPLAGGRLGGDIHADPVTDWTFVREVETCQLETNPDDPHSVNTWCTGWNGHLYVPSSMILGPTDPSERGWVLNVQTDPEVRIRIDGMVYELDAERVTDVVVYDAVLAELEDKYDADPAEREEDREIWLYRMRNR